MGKYIFIITLCTLSYFNIPSIQTHVGWHAGYNSVDLLLQQYKRSVTVLELGVRTCEYTCDLAKKFSGTYIALLVHGADKIQEIAEQKQLKNVVILQPKSITNDVLERLGKCEHFDVIIVHDINLLGDSESGLEKVFELVLKLGDHIFIDTDERTLEKAGFDVTQDNLKIITHIDNNILCLFSREKRTLEQASWWKETASGTTPWKQKYTVISNFFVKKFKKTNKITMSEWVPGINLITFFALNGVYPTDATLRAHFRALKNSEHNDLVLGNFIVQGHKLALIDFDDNRRYIDPKIALQQNIHFFRWGRPFRTMLDEFEQYHAVIDEHEE